jgi:hypothetical protein
VTIERAFAASKNRFKILDEKPFHTFPTQIKLVLACCILHNWIFGWGEDDYVQDEDDVTPDDVEGGHGVEQATPKLGRTRGMSGLSQYDFIYRNDVYG